MLLPLAPLLLFELPKLLPLLPFHVLRPEQPQRDHEESYPCHEGSLRRQTSPRCWLLVHQSLKPAIVIRIQ